MKAIICYLSYSGNTEEVAELLKRQLEENDYQVDMYTIGFGTIPDLSIYDKLFFGTFTWDRGSTPDEMKDFVREIGYKPNNVYVFGSGDTQFGGDELFCGAVDRLVKFYSCSYKGLKVEQSPRGSQEKIVTKWLKGVIENGESKNIRTQESQ